MNILHLCTKVPYPPKDGGSLATLAFVTLLRRCNFSVSILATNTNKHKVTDANNSLEGVELNSVFVNTEIFIPALLGNLLFSTLPYNITRFWDYKFKNYLIELITSKPFDIIQLEGPHLGIYLPVIRKYSKAKIVLRAHNVEHLLWQEIADQSPSFYKKQYLNILAKRVKLFENKLIAQVDAVVAISKCDLKNIQAFSSHKKSIVIPFGVDLVEYIPAKEKLENTLFFIGALDWLPNQKGLIWFLEKVWPEIKQNLPDTTFHIAGRNAPDWLKTSLILENVYFYGEIADSKEFINKYQVMVVPVFSGSGIRIKIIEGMALKKPIITTLKGAEGLNVTSGKELLIADDAATFISNVLALMRDSSKQDSLGETGRAFISKEFDNLVLSNEVKEFYQKLSY